MLQEALDLREEGAELYELLVTLSDGDWERPTPFKQWTVFDVIAHLHLSDRLAVLSLKAPQEFLTEAKAMAAAAEQAKSLTAYTREQLQVRKPSDLLRRWRGLFEEMCDLLEKVDPLQRLKWLGPDMGARTFASARQMETWAHGQDIYDLVQVRRTPTDRIKNIAVLGVNTFAWTFMNRGLEIPREVPYVRLTAPSAAIWEWNQPSEENRVEGLAVEFCHVVTQGRNVADTGLRVVGDPATRWMAIAQCFAGPPEDPPRPGQRAWE